MEDAINAVDQCSRTMTSVMFCQGTIRDLGSAFTEQRMRSSTIASGLDQRGDTVYVLSTKGLLLATC